MVGFRVGSLAAVGDKFASTGNSIVFQEDGRGVLQLSSGQAVTFHVEKQDAQHVYEQEQDGLVQTGLVEWRFTNVQTSPSPKQAQAAARPAKRAKPEGGRSGGSDRVMFVEEPVYDPEPEESKPRRVSSTPQLLAPSPPSRPYASSAAAAATTVSPPPAVVTGARELIIQVLAMAPLTEGELCRRVADVAGPELARSLLGLVARPDAEGRYELLDDPALWAAVNVRDPQLSEGQRSRIARQRQRLGVDAAEGRRAQLLARHAECRAEYSGVRELFASLYKQLRQMPTAEAANEALRLYDLHRDRLTALLQECKAIQAQLKSNAL